jgi:uncharacterized protein (TIGR02147 family)
MLSFTDDTDYREFLKNYYEQRKKQMPLYSYRMMGSKLGLDASYLYRVIQKKQHLPSHCIPALKEMLGLTGRAAEYFDILVASSRTKNANKKTELVEKALALRDVERRKINDSELRFLSQWWIPAIRAYLEVCNGKVNAKKIAKNLKPSITENQVEETIDLLKELRLVQRLSSGRLKLTDAHLTVSGPEKSKAVRAFQKQVLQLAQDALENFSVDQRDISTLTVAVDAACYEDLREMLQEFRRLVQKRVDESTSPDRVMQMSLAFYPVAPVAKEDEP